MNLAFDVETNGFLETVTKMHCLVALDVDTGTEYKFAPDKVEQGLKLLMAADQIIGHNVILYDLPVISKLYPWFSVEESRVVDTLTLSRLVFTDLSDGDRKREAFQGTRLFGTHNLEAWGLRFGQPKQAHEDWETYSPEMLERCAKDVGITARLYKYVLKKKVDPRAWTLEHKVQFILAKQERYGFPFDEAKAQAFTTTLRSRLYAIEKQVQDTFPPFYVKNGKEKEYKKETKDHWAGAYQPIKSVIFNPASRHHIANRLKFLYGWIPKEFTPSGEPKVDETVLEAMEWPEAKLLAEYFLLLKRLALVSDGDQGWLKHVRKGRVHGSIIANGAITGRGTHILIANVPRVSSTYGKECRELFTCSPGRVQLGVDAAGLELRMFSHFLSKWDGGAYGNIVASGDVHSSNQKAAGLATRDNAKTFIYAFLYGAGNEKLGSIALPNGTPAQQSKLGKKLRIQFIKSVPGLDKLTTKVRESADDKKYLVGLDGRRLHVRSAHSALNTLLQSAGALLCKQWMVEVDEEIKRRGWGTKVQQLIFYHDELQYDVDPDIAQEFGKLCVECITRAANYFGIRVPLTGEFKIGKNWADCH
jgi:DNA polymerase-1